MDAEKRKYYIQSYEFLMMGFLIDENEFTVTPGINRTLQVLEVDTYKRRKQKKEDYVPSGFELNLNIPSGSTIVQQKIEYTTDVLVSDIKNITSYDVYINNYFYGTDISNIQINTNDTLKFEVVKIDPLLNSVITITNQLI